MKLTGKSRIAIEVDIDRFQTESLRRSGLEYHLDRLFSGKEVAVEELLSWGLTITLAPDLRSATEDDVEAALADSYVAETFAGVERAALLEFWNRMADRFVGVPDD